MAISDLLTPRDEVTEGRFQGVLQAHKADGSGDRLESDPNRLLSMTYPSNALRNVFDRVDDTLRGRDDQGGIKLTGPYGSGKSHALLVLYHLFDNPDIAANWTDEWDIPLDLPSNTDATIVSTSETDADLIWESVFRGLDRENILDDITRYPTTDHIEDLASEGTTAVFFDEIETWWESFDESERSLKERNEAFFRHLLMVAKDPEEDLFVFTTLLDRSQDIKRILDRTNPHAEDLNDTGDRERIILHRLFESPLNQTNEKAVREVVNEYVDHYDYPIEIDEPMRYEDRMVETYPFHPELLNLLNSIYEASHERQNVRGAMNVLANTVRRVHNTRDLIVTSDVDPQAFRGINRPLFDRYKSDASALEDTEHATDLLQTILLYTLDERSQMASTTQCLLGTFAPSETTVDKLHMTLQNLHGAAHYLDRDRESDSYFITENPQLTALVAREQKRLLEDDRDAVLDQLAALVREDVFDGDVYVYPNEEVPDDKKMTFVVTLDYESNGTLSSQLTEFFEGRRYQNTIQFIAPKEEVRGDEAIVKKTARVFGAESLRGKVDDEQNELESLIRDERRELRSELEKRYGRWVKWSAGADSIRMRQVNVGPSLEDVRDEIGRDKGYVSEKILEEMVDADGGIRVGSMFNDFKQLRRLPVLLDNEVFYSAVRQLHRDDKIVLEGDRANFYVGQKGQYPSEIGDELTIHHPDNLDESVFVEEEETSTEGVGSEALTDTVGGSGGTGTVSGPTETADSRTATGDQDVIQGGETVATETVEVLLEGNSARVLTSTAESRVNEESDTVTRLILSYEVDNLSKSELIEFLDQLPGGNHIEANLVIERNVDE